MTDAALKFDVDRLRADLVLQGADLAGDDGLETAVLISLFSDRRAEADDAIPGGSGDRRGWWGDGWSETEGDRIGSRLWLLAREKELPSVLRRAEEYAEEALHWLIDDGVARSVQVTAERYRPGVLALQVQIRRADGELWESVWDYQL